MATDGEGRYFAADLPLGSYEIRATLPGFKEFVQSRITLVVGQLTIQAPLKQPEFPNEFLVQQAPWVPGRCQSPDRQHHAILWYQHSHDAPL